MNPRFLTSGYHGTSSSSFSAQKMETSCSYRYEYNDAQLKREEKTSMEVERVLKEGWGEEGILSCHGWIYRGACLTS